MPPGDRLLLRGLRLYGRHGVHAAETTLGQQFIVDVDVHASLHSAGRTDDIKQGIDYVKIFDSARDVVQGRPYKLVESVAEEIANRILEQFSQADEVRVRVMKPHVALPAVLDGLGVEIVRGRRKSMGGVK